MTPLKRTGFSVVLLGVCLLPFPAQSCDPAARVFFIRPFNGATVTSPVKLIFGSELVEVKAVPAGEQGGNTGHHDVLIDLDGVVAGALIQTDQQHVHFSNGETSGQINLPPGKYKLTLQFADGAERSHGPDMSATIFVTVVQ